MQANSKMCIRDRAYTTHINKSLFLGLVSMQWTLHHTEQNVYTLQNKTHGWSHVDNLIISGTSDATLLVQIKMAVLAFKNVNKNYDL